MLYVKFRTYKINNLKQISELLFNLLSTEMMFKRRLYKLEIYS